MTDEIKSPALFVIPAGTKSTVCTKCMARIYKVGKQPLRAETQCFYVKKNVTIAIPDAIAPTLTTDGKGYSHFIDCLFADDFRKRS